MIFKISIFLISFALFANNYHLEDVADTFKINKELLNKLEKNNIQTTIQFILINKDSKMRAENSKSYKISLEKLRELTSEFSLMRIKGIGPIIAKLLFRANIKSLRTFKNSNLKKLEKELIKVNKKYGISPFTPNLKNLEGWQRQVKKLKIILK